MAAMLWDVHLEGPGYEEKRLAEVGQYRKAFIARRCPSPRWTARMATTARLWAKGIYAHLSEEDRIKKEHDMHAWRMEQFKRRDEERRLKEEVAKEAGERAAAKLKQQKEEIEQKKNGKPKRSRATSYSRLRSANSFRRRTRAWRARRSPRCAR